jgi:hypothetical protein
MYKQMIVLAAVALALTASLAAQSKTVQGKEVTTTATIEGIEQGTRQLYVKRADGTNDVIYVPQEVKRFDSLKVGQKITVRYYENVVLRMAAPGAAPVDSSSRSVTPGAAGTAGTAARQQTITATISAIDPKHPSVSFTGPRGWNYTTRVEDKELLSKFKVGDKVDITWTEAMLVSVEDAK